MIFRSKEKVGEKPRTTITPRRVIGAGLVTLALASAGCETGEQSDQSKETQVKVSKVLRAAATKAARQALKIKKENPESVLYTDKQEGKQSISIYIDEKDAFSGVGKYHDKLALDVTMGTNPDTGEPEPSLVSEVSTDISLEYTDTKDKRVTHKSNTTLSYNDGSWHAMGGGTELNNGKIINNLTTAFDTRYPVGDNDLDAIDEAQVGADSIATDIEVIQDSLNNFR